MENGAFLRGSTQADISKFPSYFTDRQPNPKSLYASFIGKLTKSNWLSQFQNDLGKMLELSLSDSTLNNSLLLRTMVMA